MSKQRLLNYSADIVSASAASLVGLAAALYFHGRWYYGGWMANFGDPPMGNPSYHQFAPLFEAAPYVAAGVVVGLVSGCGRPQATRIAIRALAPLLLFLLLGSRNAQLAGSAFLPTAAGAFVFSAGLSAAYFRLLNYARRTTNVA